MKKYWFYILFLFVCLLGYGQKHIVGKTDKTSYMLGDKINYSFSIPKNETDIILNTPYQFSDTLTLISQQTDTLKDKLIYNFVFTSFANGEITLPEYFLYKQGSAKQMYVVASPTIKINFPVIDTLNIGVKGLKPIQKVPLTFMEVIRVVGVIVGIIIIALLIVFLIKYLKKRKEDKQQTTPLSKVVLESEDTEALKSLEALTKADYISKNQIKQHYVLLTDIVWRYVFRRFDINAFEMTSRQIVDALQTKNISFENMQRIRSLFETADLVKFAKHQPTIIENTSIMQEAKNFVISNGHIEKQEEDLLKGDKEGRQ